MDEIIGYQPLVNEIKDLINKKQYHVLKLMNAETINLYWEIGEEIYEQQPTFGECEIFILLILNLKNSHHWCEKLAGAIIS